MTNDGQEELCVVLDIDNTAVSDSNSIYIFNTSDYSLLFPTDKKDFTYSGLILELDGDVPQIPKIYYNNYTKINAIAVIEEESIISWLDGSFEVIKYVQKLLATDDKIGVYLNEYIKYDEFINLSVVHVDEMDYVGKEIQIITVDFSEYSITNNDFIKEITNIVVLEDRNGDGYNDLIIKNYEDVSNPSNELVYFWNNNISQFEPSGEKG